MASPETFNFTDGISGQIAKTGFMYTAYTGWAQCTIEYNPGSGAEIRAFFQFDTSALPDDATVTLVELNLVDSVIQPPSQTNSGSIWMGTWIGGTLDGNAAEFNGGTRVLAKYNFGSGFVDLGTSAKSFVNLTGATDIKVIGTYSGIVMQGYNFNRPRSKSQLRVTYTTPVGGSVKDVMTFNGIIPFKR